MPEFVEEDDVEFLYESGPIVCQLCSTSLQKASPEQRQAHYDRHFPDEPQVSGSGSGSGSTVPQATVQYKPAKGWPKLQVSRPPNDVPPTEQNVFWTQEYSTVPPKNFAPGLILILKHALLKTHAKGITTRAMLCHEGITHVATECWDRGWGCGYRNFLMACTALVSQTLQPLYSPLLNDPTPPGVRNLQVWIQDAWANGFDRVGAEQLKYKLVGSKKWIGTAELYVAFVSRGIPAQLVDFPGSKRGPLAVTDWITNYFSPPVLNKGQSNAFNALKGASPILCTERMPVILQHSGHSRTVVGVEVNKKGSRNLLVFDPSIRPSRSLRRAALAKHPSLLSPTRSKGGSPSILRRALRSPGIKSYEKRCKRRASGEFPGDDVREVKRVRGGGERPTGKEHAAIVVDDSGDSSDVEGVNADAENLDPIEVVNFFRISESKLGKNKKYQILWFPLDPPLEDAERWARRVVTSEQVV